MPVEVSEGEPALTKYSGVILHVKVLLVGCHAIDATHQRAIISVETARDMLNLDQRP